jgi:predicted HAD superfamily Cof-like phosphohydrolase
MITTTATNMTPLIKLRLDLIKEEIEELNDAIKQNDVIEQRDACADILYVVYGMADVLGISIDDLFTDKIQNKSNSNTINNTTSTNFNNVKQFANEIKEYKIGEQFRNLSIPNSNCNLETEIKKTTIELIRINMNRIYLELEFSCSKYNYEENNKIKVEIANHIYELLKWTYLMTIEMGVDADADFDIVHNSNMSKLCDNEEDAKETVNDYKNKYNSRVSPYDSPYYYYLPNLNKWIVKNLSTGKALKNIKYKKVCFI